eukprot:scaffold1110_cov254-Pinguiococcus_pyrenoidosus.AAC.4
MISQSGARMMPSSDEGRVGCTLDILLHDGHDEEPVLVERLSEDVGPRLVEGHSKGRDRGRASSQAFKGAESREVVLGIRIQQGVFYVDGVVVVRDGEKKRITKPKARHGVLNGDVGGRILRQKAVWKNARLLERFGLARRLFDSL